MHREQRGRHVPLCFVHLEGLYMPNRGHWNGLTWSGRGGGGACPDGVVRSEPEDAAQTRVAVVWKGGPPRARGRLPHRCAATHAGRTFASLSHRNATKTNKTAQNQTLQENQTTAHNTRDRSGSGAGPGRQGSHTAGEGTQDWNIRGQGKKGRQKKPQDWNIRG